MIEASLSDNAFLESLNELLEQQERSAYRDLEERFPTVHVLGLPRSGTTLAVQLLVANTDIAYIDHVAAAFWRAPATGLRLSETLRRHVARPASYASDFGRTAALTEPHEFHYLWARLLGTPYGLESLKQDAEQGPVDWEFFRRVITNMSEVVERPLVFKSFHAIWHLADICETLAKTVVVLVRRDPLDVAQSLLKMREGLYGTREQWASIKPREYSWLQERDYATQIAGQIFYVNRAIADGVRNLDPEALVEASYDQVCRDPAGFLDRVVAAVERRGGTLHAVGSPEPFETSAGPGDPDTAAELRNAIARFDADHTPEDNE